MTPLASATLSALDIRGAGHPTAVLRHDQPDGSHHFDWMLAADADGTATLTAFRLPAPLRDLIPGRSAEALRLPDHRPVYLHFEGPISGHRGRVSRLSEGRIVDAQMLNTPTVEQWEVTVEWRQYGGHPAVSQILRISHSNADWWIVEDLKPRSSAEPRISQHTDMTSQSAVH